MKPVLEISASSLVLMIFEKAGGQTNRVILAVKQERIGNEIFQSYK